jgi:hypothetical protein
VRGSRWLNAELRRAVAAGGVLGAMKLSRTQRRDRGQTMAVPTRSAAVHVIMYVDQLQPTASGSGDRNDGQPGTHESDSFYLMRCGAR